MVGQLADHEHARLRAAGIFVEMEELACEIGDELTRQLMRNQLAQRSHEAASANLKRPLIVDSDGLAYATQWDGSSRSFASRRRDDGLRLQQLYG